MKAVQGFQVGATGTEQSADFSQNTEQAAASAAESGAISTDSIAADPDLETVVKAWPTLPFISRQAILVLVRKQSSD